MDGAQRTSATRMADAGPTILLTMLGLFVPLTVHAGGDGKFPWKLQQNYKYLWYQKSDKIGETLLHFEKPPNQNDPVYRLTMRRRLEYSGRVEVTEGDLYFLENGKPLTYLEETRFTAPGGQLRGVQELQVSFYTDKVHTKYVNNGRRDAASVREVAIKGKTYLFATNAIEQWVAFCPQLLGARERTLNLFYPEFATVLDFVLVREKTATTIRCGDRDVETTRYRFENKLYRFEGTIWIDADGRLARYQSATLKVELDAAGK